MNFKEIEKKWQKKWEEAKIFEADAQKGKEKFFVTFPYPYMNAYLHLGHFLTLTRTDIFARYKRMRGFNVLFPQGWHCTGSPIENAAKRIREGEPKQIKIMKDMGFSDEEIKKFADPKYWVEYFPKEAEKDVKSIGASIDFRRSFITTELNPHYDKFIRWQFRKLKEKGYVVKGKHPVVWCKKCNSPVGDHSRVEGEGEVPQEWTLTKFKFDDSYLVSATLRPETVFGITNVWVNPELEYVIAKVDGEKWIISEQAAEKLKEQEKEVKIIGKIKGKELIGKYCVAPLTKRKVIILPSFFCDPERGTGIVSSVPSDAPDDYIALKELKENEELCKRYGLNFEEVKKIEIIPIINTKEMGNMPAKKVVEEMGIKSQNEREALEKARKIVYKAGYYQGTMNENCGEYAGMKVEVAKELIKKELIESGEGDIFYELTGRVVCRCLTPSIVKIVKDQWFLKYGDKEWKKLAHKALDRMKLYPEKVRTQFNYVIDWLNDWACTREYGLGTRLPWDEKWVIESLSDSTIYMAYYTIAHLIKKVPIEKINDAFFDYVFFGRGEKPDVENIEKMREEFEYWYPLDFRNSGKDLVQNHLTFFIFNHVAIFPERHWPRAIGVNGFVTIDGEKMSKSKGNFILVRDLIKKFSVDASRMTITYGGEELDDVNWDSELVKSLNQKLEQLYEFCVNNYGKGSNEMLSIDKWMNSKINEIIKESTEFMEEAMFRSALQRIYFDFQRYVKWYLKRNPNPNKEVMKRLIETQVLLLSPFAPFICEEIWEKIGKEGFVSLAQWPVAGEIDKKLDIIEEVIQRTIEDIHSVVRLSKLEKIKKMKIFIAKSWKYKLFDAIKDVENKKNFNEMIEKAMKIEEVKKNSKEVVKIIKAIAKDPSKFPLKMISKEKEIKVFKESKEFFEKEFECEVEVIDGDESNEVKAQQALPMKPGILVM